MEKRFIFFQHVLVLLMCAAHSYCLSSTPQPIPIQPIPQAPVLANPPTPTSAAPASTPVAPAAAAASPVVVSDLQKKIDAANAEPTVLKKISTCKDAIALVGKGTIPSETESIRHLVKGLVKALATMVAQEIQALIELCTLITKNAFILSSDQRVVMDQWLKTLALALRITTGTDTLMTCLKKSLATPPTKDWNSSNYSLFIQEAILAGNLLVSDPNNPNPLPKEEGDINNQHGLLYKLKQAGYIILGNRARISTANLSDFLGFITLTKTHAELKDSIVPAWETTLSIDIALNPTNKKSVMDQIKDATATLALFTKDSDPYEKGLYISALATIFSNRKDRSINELTAFKALIDTILTSTTTKNIFDVTTLGQIKGWQSILQATLVLVGSSNTLDVKTKIAMYQPIMSNIVGDGTDYEKKLFFDGLSSLFNARGDLGTTDLATLKDFLTTVQKTQALLNIQQANVINAWLQEISGVQNTTSTNQVAGSGQAYLSTLITQATQASSIDLFNKCLTLISFSTSQAVKNAFISGLNDLFNKRQNIDKKALFIFLKDKVKKAKIIEPGKTEGVDLLNSEQTAVIHKWIKTLKLESVTV